MHVSQSTPNEEVSIFPLWKTALAAAPSLLVSPLSAPPPCNGCAGNSVTVQTTSPGPCKDAAMLSMLAQSGVCTERSGGGCEVQMNCTLSYAISGNSLCTGRIFQLNASGCVSLSTSGTVGPFTPLNVAGTIPLPCGCVIVGSLVVGNAAASGIASCTPCQ